MKFEKIKGFGKLSPDKQKLFQNIYKRHQSALGTEAKKDYEPVSVSWEKTYFKVIFKNGDWLHYSPNGDWW